TWTLGDCLNAGLDQATGDYITKMDDDDHYGPHHLTDLHTAHNYSNAHIVGKSRSFVYLSEFGLTVGRHIGRTEAYRDHVSGATLTMQSTDARGYGVLRRNSRVDTTLLQRVLQDGGLIYRTHPLGFVVTRNASGHTWNIGYGAFVQGATTTESGVS